MAGALLLNSLSLDSALFSLISTLLALIPYSLLFTVSAQAISANGVATIAQCLATQSKSGVQSIGYGGIEAMARLIQ